MSVSYNKNTITNKNGEMKMAKSVIRNRFAIQTPQSMAVQQTE